MKAGELKAVAEKEAGAWADSMLLCRTDPIIKDQKEVILRDLENAVCILEQAGFVVLPKEELEAALKPFAEWAKRIPETAPDALVIRSTMADPGGPRGIATALNFRRAAALLAAITQETKE